MALTTAYSSGLLALTDGSVAFATDDCYAVLVNGYTFSAAHSTYADVSGSEITSTDYDPVALTSKTVEIDGSDVLYDCDNISYGDPVSIGPADGVVILQGTAATPQSTDAVLLYAPLNDLQSTDATFAINTPNGLYRIERA